MSNMKTCNKCKEEKLLTEYHKRKLSKDGLALWCKSCKINQVAEWRNHNPRANKEYYYNNKQHHLASQKSRRESIQAVYGIFSDDKVLYIGKSKQFLGRLNNHNHCLKNQDMAEKHHPTMAHLYPLLRQHSNVDIRIIEECSSEVLLDRETYYIHAYKPLYNIDKT